MSELNAADLAEKGHDEKLGAYLRRARQAAKLEVVDLARKIRIAPDVLQHIEESKWELFPVEAYVRGYLNSICIHLELDRNKVLGWFGSEYHSNYAMPSVTPIRDVGLVQPTAASNSNSKLIPALIVILIVVFFVVMHLLRKSDPEPIAPPPAMDTLPAAVQPVDTQAVGDSIVDSLLDSTGASQADTLAKDTLRKAATPDTAKAEEKPAKKSGKQTSILLECLRDSVWVRIDRAGENVRTYQIQEGKPRYFSHNDTIRVRIAAPERTRLYIDDQRARFRDNKNLTIVDGKLVRTAP